jgi:hypothetical protein
MIVLIFNGIMLLKVIDDLLWVIGFLRWLIVAFIFVRLINFK